MWPLIAIVSLLAVALVAILIVILVQPQDGDKNPTSAPPKTPSSSPSTPSSSPTSDTVPIEQADYVGLPVDEAIQKLNDLDAGFEIETVDGPVADAPAKVGTVQRISPVGNVRRNQTITLAVYRAPGTPPAPTAPTASSDSGDAGDGIDLAFSYSGCPAGFDLQGYTFTLQNADPVGGSLDLPADATSLTITLKHPRSTATAAFVAKCAGGLTSPSSGPAEIAVNP